MTGKVVNLRAARKAKARDAKAATASANAAKHGRTKGERLREAAETLRETRRLDGHERE